LYIYKYNNGNPKIIFYKEGINSQSIFAGDLNNNGKTEIAFQSETGYKFYEFGNNGSTIPTPEITDAFSTGSNSAFLKWNVTSGKSYIFRGIEKQSLNIIDSTSSTNFNDNNLNNQTNYYYAIQNFNGSEQNPYSSLSATAEVFIHPKTRIDTVFLVSQKNIIVKFTGKMKNTIDNIGVFEVAGFGNPKSVSANSEYSYLLNYQSPFAAKRNYSLEISGLRDFYNSPLDDESRNFTSSAADTSAQFYISSFNIVNNYSVKIEFNLDIDSSSAKNSGNYSFSPSNIANEISVDNSQKNKLILHTKNPVGSIGKEYTLRISNLFSSTATGNVEINNGAGSEIVLTVNADNLNDVYVYPNPVKLNSTFETKVTFANVTQNAEVQVFSIAGKKIIVLKSSDNNGGIIWNLRNLNGNIVESGVYIYRIVSKTKEGKDKQEMIGKFAVIR